MPTKRNKTMSQKQIEANRANATKSTGPRTPEGKARSALNATTHGLTAQSLVHANNANERIEDFITLHTELVTDLKPVGRNEEALVQRIAICYWRLNRAYRFESNSVANARTLTENENAIRDEDDPVPPLDPASIVLPESQDLESLIRYEGLIDRELHRTQNQLNRSQHLRLKKEQAQEDSDEFSPEDEAEFTNAMSQIAQLQSHIQFPATAVPQTSAAGAMDAQSPSAASSIPQATSRSPRRSPAEPGKSHANSPANKPNPSKPAANRNSQIGNQNPPPPSSQLSNFKSAIPPNPNHSRQSKTGSRPSDPNPKSEIRSPRRLVTAKPMGEAGLVSAKPTGQAGGPAETGIPQAPSTSQPFHNETNPSEDPPRPPSTRISWSPPTD
jgi:hypothetical protein